jgi:hypothetical protein
MQSARFVERDAEAAADALGHELFHALEVAGAPEVRDENSLRAFYDQVGFMVGRRCGARYDTAEARATARAVAQEVDTLRGVEAAWTPRWRNGSRSLDHPGLQVTGRRWASTRHRHRS